MENEMIMIDDVEYKLADLPQNVQQMLAVWNVWQKELEVARLNNLKLELALRSLGADIGAAVKEQAEAPAAE